jgi:hypothetical protein
MTGRKSAAPGDFSKCETVEEVVDDLLKYSLNPSCQIATERDRQELIDMTERHYAEMQEVLDAIKARPINGIESKRSQHQQLEHKKFGRGFEN